MAWAVAVLAMAYPSGPHPFPLALALGLGALLAFERRPALAGALAGASAAWRAEFAAALVAGIVLAGWLGGWAPLRASLARFAACAAGSAALLIGPVVVAAGLGRSWDLLVDFPLTDFRDYQTLPFPLDYDGPLNTSSPGGFLSDSAEPLLLFYLPLVLVLGLAVAAAALAPGIRREPLHVATGVYALCMLAYLLVRPDLFHTAPLAVLVAVLLAWALPRHGWIAPVAAAVLAFAVVEGLDRRWLALREDTSALALAPADGVRARPAQARALERLATRIDGLLAPGDPVYVATSRSDLMTSGHPLLYFLLRRPNPTRYDIAQPGVVTTAAVQREIVAAIERARVRVVVRFDDPITKQPEPNAAGRSSGVRILDAHLETAFAETDRIGPFVILTRRT